MPTLRGGGDNNSLPKLKNTMCSPKEIYPWQGRTRSYLLSYHGIEDGRFFLDFSVKRQSLINEIRIFLLSKWG